MVLFDINPRASALGVKSYFLTTASIRAFLSAETGTFPFKKRETVATETPLSWAIWVIVIVDFIICPS